MTKPFSFAVAGADVGVWRGDHLPPHVHAEHEPNRWEMRVKIHFYNRDPECWDITEGGKNAKRPRVSEVNLIIEGVRSHLKQLRDDWWAVYQNTGLENKWVLEGSGTIKVLEKRSKNARQVTSATYDPATGKTTVTLDNGRIYVVG